MYIYIYIYTHISRRSQDSIEVMRKDLVAWLSSNGIAGPAAVVVAWGRNFLLVLISYY